MKCVKCGTQCCRDEVDVGVGIVYGPFGCPGCGWSEDPTYDISEGEKLHELGWTRDQFGGLNPPINEDQIINRFKVVK